jgi:hypothetical protein
MQKGKCFITDNKGMQIIQAFNAIQPAKGNNNEFIYPLKVLSFIRQKLMQKQINYQFIAEQGYLKGGLKKRVLRELFINKNQIKQQWSQYA